MSGPTRMSARILTRLQPVHSVAPLRAISVNAELGLGDPGHILIRLENGHEGAAPYEEDGILWAVQGHRFIAPSAARLLARRLIEAADLLEGGH